MSILLCLDKDVLKAFSNHSITYNDERRKRKNKGVEIRVKRDAKVTFTPEQISTAETITMAKRNSKTGREVLQTNVEGEQYAMIKPGDSNSITNPRQEDYSPRDDDKNIPKDSELTEYQTPDILNFSFTNSTDHDTVVNIDYRRGENVEDDKISQLISNCVRDTECSKHATCVRKSLKQKGFCRCLPGFYGPGIFCKEDM